jgi:hypothetical protein
MWHLLDGRPYQPIPFSIRVRKMLQGDDGV